jgi:predicted esterase
MSDTSSTKAALIFLHGLDGSPEAWSLLRQTLPNLRPSLSGVHFVFMTGRPLPITVRDGSVMRGWFDLYDWPIAVSARDDRDGLLASVQHVRQQVQQLVQEEGIPKDRIVLAGFSQGGAVAMLAAYTDPDRYAGCVSLSGWLTLAQELQVTTEARSTPLLWCHGTRDDIVPLEQQAHGIQALKERGLTSIQEARYDMDHSHVDAEIAAVADFLEQVLFPCT